MNSIATIVLGFTLPFLMTTLGASLIFFFNKTSKIVSMITIGLAAGIMLSASIWSLLIPALENAQESMGNLAFLPVVLGFIFGAVFMVLLDLFCSRFFKNDKKIKKKRKKITKIKSFLKKSIIYSLNHTPYYLNSSSSSRPKRRGPGANGTALNLRSHCSLDFSTSLRFARNDTRRSMPYKLGSFKNSRQREKAFKLFTAITIHNIPEGMSVGFAIGTAVALNSPLLSAFMFALGIALQNFPEGLATALPMQNSFHHRGKAFALGTLSGLVEPIFAILGFFLAAYITALLPWLLAFSAGAMIYVIVQEMIPEIHMEGGCSWGTWAFVLGFVMMMILDICL